MATALLDLNVLLALAWPNHEHHRTARTWFDARQSDQWATCPMTQCGFVRISSNPKIIVEAVSPQQASTLLQKMMQDSRHVFWEDQISFPDAVFARFPQLRGHRQVTDAYLLGLCLSRGQQLATFDQGILSLAVSENERQSVLLIPS